MKKIFGVMAVAMLLAGALVVPAGADDAVPVAESTCKDLAGFSTNLESNSAGDWGSITFSDKEKELTLVVAAGWEVELCVKAGSGNQGDGPENAGTFGEGTHKVAHSSNKDLSHYAFVARETDDEEPPVLCSDLFDNPDFPDVVIEEGDNAEELCFEEEEEPDVSITVSGNSACVGLEDEEERFLGLFVSVDTDSEEEVTLLVDGEEVDLDGDGGILLDWPFVDGEPAASVELSASVEGVSDSTTVLLDEDEVEACAVEVLPEPPVDVDPVDEDDVDTVKVVKKTEVLASVETLPQTGASALVLALLGLSAMGSGGALLRRRR